MLFTKAGVVKARHYRERMARVNGNRIYGLPWKLASYSFFCWQAQHAEVPGTTCSQDFTITEFS